MPVQLFGADRGASTINGTVKRLGSIRCNEADIGPLAFDRVGMVKAPETGKRVSTW